MKKKSLCLFLSLSMALSLTGCNFEFKIPFIGGDKEESTTPGTDEDFGDLGDVPDITIEGIYIKDDLSFNIGDEISVEDLLDIDDEVLLNILDMQIISNIGTAGPTYVLDEVGVDLPFVAHVEMSDGTVNDIPVNITVDGESAGSADASSGADFSMFPSELADNLSSGLWSPVPIETGAIMSSIYDDYVADTAEDKTIDLSQLVEDIGSAYGSNTVSTMESIELLGYHDSLAPSTYTDNAVAWAVAEYPSADKCMECFVDMGLSYNTLPAADMYMTVLSELQMRIADSDDEDVADDTDEDTDSDDSDVEDAGTVDDENADDTVSDNETGSSDLYSDLTFTQEEADYIKQLAEWSLKYYCENMTVNAIPVDKVMYDVDGNTYDVTIIEHNIDYSELGESEPIKYTRAFRVSKDSSDIVFVLAYDGITNSNEAILKMLAECKNADKNVKSYEEFITAAKAGKMPIFGLNAFSHNYTVSNFDGALDGLLRNVVIGDTTTLQTSGSGSGSSSSGGGVQIDISTTITPGQGEDEIEPSTTPEESGAVADIMTSYKEKFPDIYSWPTKDTKFRRWEYVIDDQTTYIGSIIGPDGTIITSKGSVDMTTGDAVTTLTPDETDITGESSSTPDTSSETDSGNASSYTLSSSYGDYNVSNKEVKGAVLNTAMSRSNRLEFMYQGQNYYIECARASLINSYLASCLYNTSNMQDAEYQITEADTSKRVDTDLGTITLYEITYTTLEGEEVTRPYISVYNINNDYLCMYADNIPETDDVFLNIFSKMIVE